MATVPNPPPTNLGQKLQSLPRPLLYLLLILATSIPLFFNIKLPNKPGDGAIDFYTAVMQVPEGSTVLLSTEWTSGTRAENAGEFEALLRMLMQRHVKFVLFSIGDAQAPPVAKESLMELNEERKKNGLPPYERWKDWVDCGYFANPEGQAESIANSVKAAFAGKKDLNLQGVNEDVFDSPVLKNVSSLKDTPLFFEVTASSTSTVYIQRISSKVKIALMVTGVMGPEAYPYYASGQVVGLVNGLKGVSDLETLMEHGVNVKNDPDSATSTKTSDVVPGFWKPSMYASGKGRGETYYPALNVALVVLILAIVIGNVGMFIAKKEAK